MIEVEVHQQLRAFLREQGEPYWQHHLTMARLVARALRLGRSALLQAGAPSGYHGRYRLSYLMPLLIWQGSAILVAPEAIQQRLLMVEIPRLRQWIATHKSIRTGDRWLNSDFQGLLLTTPQDWLGDRLLRRDAFPSDIPTIIDGVDDLESWIHDLLTVSIHPWDWDELMGEYPEQADTIRNVRVQLTRVVFQHPPNPYDRYLMDTSEQEALLQLGHCLRSVQTHRQAGLFERWNRFWQAIATPERIFWAQVARSQGNFVLHCSPADIAPAMRDVWSQQPVVLIGGALDLEADAPIYRQRLGLGNLTCLKFAPDRQTELIQLYLPDRLPLPNTPQFQAALLGELRTLLNVSSACQGLTVVIIGDVPLKAQVGSILAAELGSRVQVEKTCLDEHGILVTGWQFWREHQGVLPAPHLLAVATLPIPSLEDPLVAGRVAYYKQSHQDWFRLYLLPQALSELQRAIAPVRESQGVVALLDNRINHRTYGQQVLAALSPLARINYVDANLFSQFDCSLLD